MSLLKGETDNLIPNKMKKDLRIVDGFAWLIVNKKAKKIFEHHLFDLYVLHADGTETLIESFSDLLECLEINFDIAIEVGHINQ